MSGKSMKIDSGLHFSPNEFFPLPLRRRQTSSTPVECSPRDRRSTRTRDVSAYPPESIPLRLMWPTVHMSAANAMVFITCFFFSSHFHIRFGSVSRHQGREGREGAQGRQHSRSAGTAGSARTQRRNGPLSALCGDDECGGCEYCK